jgi:ABC-2 type transport system permease protein
VRTALLVAAHEIRLRIRDRSVIILGFIAPFALSAIMGLAFGGSSGSKVRVALADDDHSLLSQRIVSGDLRPQTGAGLRLIDVPDGSTARRKVHGNHADTAIVIPPGFGAAVAAGRPSTIEVIRHHSRPLDADAAATLAGGVTSKITAEALSGTTHLATPTLVEDATIARASPLGYFGPSMAILFLYFSVGAGARALMAETRMGTMARLRLAPVRFGSVIVGKLLAVFAVALTSMLLLWAATVNVFGASWGDPLGVVVLCVAVVFAISGIASFIAVSAKNEEGADGATAIVAFGLALLGGNFFPPGALPDLFEKLSRLTPNGAALQAFARLSIDHGGIGAIGPALVVLVSVAVVFGFFGTLRLALRSGTAT